MFAGGFHNAFVRAVLAAALVLLGQGVRAAPAKEAPDRIQFSSSGTMPIAPEERLDADRPAAPIGFLDQGNSLSGAVPSPVLVDSQSFGRQARQALELLDRRRNWIRYSTAEDLYRTPSAAEALGVDRYLRDAASDPGSADELSTKAGQDTWGSSAAGEGLDSDFLSAFSEEGDLGIPSFGLSYPLSRPAGASSSLSPVGLGGLSFGGGRLVGDAGAPKPASETSSETSAPLRNPLIAGPELPSVQSTLRELLGASGLNREAEEDFNLLRLTDDTTRQPMNPYMPFSAAEPPRSPLYEAAPAVEGTSRLDERRSSIAGELNPTALGPSSLSPAVSTPLDPRRLNVRIEPAGIPRRRF